MAGTSFNLTHMQLIISNAEKQMKYFRPDFG
jgi:hypothetical protein